MLLCQTTPATGSANSILGQESIVPTTSTASSLGSGKKARSNSLETIASNPKRTRNSILEDAAKNSSATTTAAIPASNHAFAAPTSSFFSIPNQLNISIEKATLKDYRRVAKTLLLAFEDDPFTNFILNTTKYSKATTSENTYKKKKLDLMLSYFEYSAYDCLSTDGTVFIIKDNNFEQSLTEFDIKNTDKFPFLGVALWNQIYGQKVSDSSSGSDSDYDDEDYFAPESSSIFNKSLLKFNLKAVKGRCRFKVFKDKLPYLVKVRNEVLISQLLCREDDHHHFPCDLDIWYLGDIATLPSMRGKGLGKILMNYARDQFLMENKKSYMYLESSNPLNRNFYLKMGYSLMKSYSIRDNKYVDLEKVLRLDPKNKAVNMDAMLYYP
ncbi:hypothetical protein Cantr_07597 [Candida viswanathii]|uniref:N-acetyltransferase domain-containing protein n=1 Tax=Candida viswanathii TaxID=5486 RepID=A0A367Y132_9ASCO|nr:hypothetical protein Cantr_07597 [Candida viswanathii]